MQLDLTYKYKAVSSGLTLVLKWKSFHLESIVYELH